MHTARSFAYLLAIGLVTIQTAGATQVPRLTFEQLTDASEVIASGQITNSWTAWDREHKYIWTHYNLRVTSAVKGAAGPVVEFGEPGGALEGTSMLIAGSVDYAAGENMVVFLSRMPNGFLRTTGWAQGKYSLDAAGKIHSQAMLGADILEAGHTNAGSSLSTLEGLSFSELVQRVTARMRQTQTQEKVK